ncbi:hypothetical protein A2U01_0066412, partial [Trifolium medium]|nr:hypothetical protein [Trifolium medium]
KQWRQQVSGVIRAFDLQKYITDPSIPEKFLIDDDRTAGTVNPLHQDWEKTMRWYVFGSYPPFLSHFLGNSLITRVLGKFGKKFSVTFVLFSPPKPDSSDRNCEP